MEEASSEESELRKKYEDASPTALAGVFSKLSTEKLPTDLIKEIINQKLSVVLDEVKTIKEIKVILNNVVKVLGDDNITPENKVKISGLEETAIRLLTEKINKATSPQDLKDIKPDVETYAGANKPFDIKKSEILQKHTAELRNPNIPLDEKLMIYTAAEESKVFDAKEMGALKEVLKEQISSKIDAIKKDQPLPSFKEILTLNLCVKALNDPSVSKAFESKQKILKSNLSEKTAIASLDEIDQDKKLTPVEKTQQIDGLLAVYHSLHGKVPKKLEEKYTELSEKYRDQTVTALHEYGTGLFANVDVDAMQRQAFNKDRSQRKPPGETNAGKPLSGGFNAISGSVVNSVLENRDFNAGILATKRWIETAAMAYQEGDLYSSQAVLSGLKTATIHPYLTAVIKEKGLHAELKETLDVALSSDRAYKNLRASEAVAGDKSLPAVGYKFSDMTFTYEGNPRKEGEADKRPLLLEPFYSEFRSRKNSLGNAPTKDLTDTFGSELIRPVEEQSSDRYRKTIDKNKGEEISVSFQSQTVETTKNKLADKKSAVESYQAPAKKVLEKAEQLQVAEAYNRHMENNGGVSKNFYSSPEYAAFLKAQHQDAGKRPVSESIAQASAQEDQREKRSSQVGSVNKWSSIATLPPARTSISSSISLGGSRRATPVAPPLPDLPPPLPELPPLKKEETSENTAATNSTNRVIKVLDRNKGALPKAAPPPPPFNPNDTSDDMMGPSKSGQSEKQPPPLPEEKKEAPKLQSDRPPPPSHMRSGK